LGDGAVPSEEEVDREHAAREISPRASDRDEMFGEPMRFSFVGDIG
jgi:hypothetical protein